MSDCKHLNMLIQPKHIEKKGDGVVVKDLIDSTATCRDCDEPLAAEDMSLYDDSHLFVAVPQDLFEEE